MRVYGIASQDDPNSVQNFADTFGLTFPILIDPQGKVHRNWAMASAFKSAAFPQDWIVGPDGRIVYENNGFEPDEMRFVLDQVLAE